VSGQIQRVRVAVDLSQFFQAQSQLFRQRHHAAAGEIVGQHDHQRFVPDNGDCDTARGLGHNERNDDQTEKGSNAACRQP
jgi:hypothetical protein